jgi:hypothetical protein
MVAIAPVTGKGLAVLEALLNRIKRVREPVPDLLGDKGALAGAEDVERLLILIVYFCLI